MITDRELALITEIDLEFPETDHLLYRWQYEYEHRQKLQKALPDKGGMGPVLRHLAESFE
jgi:hypothetical protein